MKAGEPEIQGEGDSADEADQGADPSSTEPGADTGATDTANPNHIELKTKEQIAWETKEAKRSGARQALARKQRKDLAVEAVKGGNAVPRGICMAYWARDGCKMVKGRSNLNLTPSLSLSVPQRTDERRWVLKHTPISKSPKHINMIVDTSILETRNALTHLQL